jgi:hypothetical protein
VAERVTGSESICAYFKATRAHLDPHGKPVAFYSDKASVFRSTQKSIGDQSPNDSCSLGSTGTVDPKRPVELGFPPPECGRSAVACSSGSAAAD